jgi:hypothetical protein
VVKQAEYISQGHDHHGFFYVTPAGRILNQFSRDLRQVEDPLSLPPCGCLCTFSRFTPFILCAGVFFPLTVVLVHVTKYFPASACEIKRLDSITRLLFLYLVSETNNGVEKIRAYRMTRRSPMSCSTRTASFFPPSRRPRGGIHHWNASVMVAAGLALTYAARLTRASQRMTNLVTQTKNIMICFERVSCYERLDEEGRLMELLLLVRSIAMRLSISISEVDL